MDSMTAPGRPPGNSGWWRRAQDVLPGGVNSPVRAFKAVPGDPIFFKSAKGSRFEDEDGRSYIDYCQSWGPMILGHADPDVQAAVEAAVAEGMSFGAPSRREVLLAEAFLERVPIYDKVRFVSSGTEAVMSAIRLARGFTGRDLIVKFAGCYHGHADSLLVEAGSGLATFGNPSSGGIPADFTRHTAVLPLNDEGALSRFFKEHGDKVAALIIEPVPANAGLLIQREEFLKLCRELTAKHNALLIFDEVITGFRVGPGGAALLFGIKPDLGTYGKIIGGGMPVGAFAARKEIMDQISPAGPVYQAGTLSGNPVAMAAGLAALKKTGAPGFYEKLEQKSARLEKGLTEAIDAAGVPARFIRFGSLFWLAFQKEQPRAFSEIGREGMKLYGRFHRSMLEEGVYLAPSGYEVGFVSSAHTAEDLQATIDAARNALRATAGATDGIKH
ncbi:MAG: glutamate-1-semialdehyde 2,1-aminomutase [Candidatus Eisenbacteria bacterium]|uniref:Glutamate-1-semialdehyde 2,1-aminomutase n=1 Tax=Eiseniibacteriota bacterium TaxID=2212470 RepID=A0A948RWZ6_UNCEI|nr:glutamate-1-semialdehyde 2,1-aminomutase [Candidatus Eisenbacteria bacterium]MBU1950287.1 glutamate-1-semialdehyde 2,1-aminomutase [Candidatus Eisenbacteria bacterium]MBU2691501.1 glutamate-1-semialdehyde 2,1-aminomutase [Candidatus Eisenbacteria bacterium]